MKNQRVFTILRHYDNVRNKGWEERKNILEKNYDRQNIQN